MIPLILPPMQFPPHSIHEADFGQLDEAEGVFVLTQSKLVGRADGGKTAIECTEEAFGPPFNFEANDRIIADHNRPNIQVMRGYGGDHKIATTGKYNGAATT